MHATSGDGTTIYYETHGDGDPVLLIPGLGSNAYGWWRTIPWLSQTHHAIAIDNRGTGRSDVPEGPYSMEQLADDAVAVLDQAGIERAHVIGVSLGGMITQRLAIRHPERLRSITLVCTSPGGAERALAAPEVMAALRERVDPRVSYIRNAWYLFSQNTRDRYADRIVEENEARAKILTTAPGYFGQLAASATHDVTAELPSLNVPALVVHGDADMLIPASEGRRIASLLPGAELVIIPGAGHMLWCDAEDELREAISSFLARVTV